MLDYELGYLHVARELFKQYERRDPAEVLNGSLPESVSFASQRDFVRKVLVDEVNLRAKGTQFVEKSQDLPASRAYREFLASEKSPSETVAAGYQWIPGGELSRKVANL